MPELRVDQHGRALTLQLLPARCRLGQPRPGEPWSSKSTGFHLATGHPRTQTGCITLEEVICNGQRMPTRWPHGATASRGQPQVNFPYFATLLPILFTLAVPRPPAVLQADLWVGSTNGSLFSGDSLAAFNEGLAALITYDPNAYAGIVEALNNGTLLVGSLDDPEIEGLSDGDTTLINLDLVTTPYEWATTLAHEWSHHEYGNNGRLTPCQEATNYCIQYNILCNMSCDIHIPCAHLREIQSRISFNTAECHEHLDAGYVPPTTNTTSCCTE